MSYENAVKKALESAQLFALNNPTWRMAKGVYFMAKGVKLDNPTGLSIQLTAYMAEELNCIGTVRVIRDAMSVMVRVVVCNPHFIEVELPEIQVFVQQWGETVCGRILVDGDLLAQFEPSVGTVANARGWALVILEGAGLLDHLPVIKRKIELIKNVHLLVRQDSEPFPAVDRRFNWPLV